MTQIDANTRPDWHYHQQFASLDLTEFWTFDKCKCITSTVEFLSRVPADTVDVTMRVARMNLVKLIMLRLLRLHLIKMLPELIESRMMRMMELDVFDAVLCRLINEHFERKA